VIAVTVCEVGNKLLRSGANHFHGNIADVDVTSRAFRSSRKRLIAEPTSPEGESKPPSRARMIVVLGALVALGPLTIDMYLPALPKIADDLSVSSSVAQLTLTGTLAGLALGQLIVGPLSDSLGRRGPLMAGIVLHMLASLLCLFAPNIAALGVARGLQGMGAALRWWLPSPSSVTCSPNPPRPRCCRG